MYSAKNSLKERLIPPGFIINGFIKGDHASPLYNYEDWLRELINSSPAFLLKSSGEEFMQPKDESHGEADAVSSIYSIDFKLIAGQSMLHALREMTAQKMVAGSLYLTCTSRRTGSMQGLSLHNVIRTYSADDLRRIWNADSRHSRISDEEREVATFLELLKTKKNLLLLYPALLIGGDEMPSVGDVASEAVFSDYANALMLRKEYLPGFESYLAFFLNGYLMILEVRDTDWILFDRVPVKMSKTFMEISRHYDLLDFLELDTLLGRQ